MTKKKFPHKEASLNSFVLVDEKPTLFTTLKNEENSLASPLAPETIIPPD